jgi:hypothetical protein
MVVPRTHSRSLFPPVAELFKSLSPPKCDLPLACPTLGWIQFALMIFHMVLFSCCDAMRCDAMRCAGCATRVVLRPATVLRRVERALPTPATLARAMSSTPLSVRDPPGFPSLEEVYAKMNRNVAVRTHPLFHVKCRGPPRQVCRPFSGLLGSRRRPLLTRQSAAWPDVFVTPFAALASWE